MTAAPCRHTLVAVLFAACGGDPAPAEDETTPVPVATSGGSANEVSPTDDEGFEVRGTLGTLTEQEVADAVSRRFDGFLACFSAGMAEVELLSGDVTFTFHVIANGAVDRASLLGSTVGHRATERCLVQEASRVRFPRPRGGSEAEVTLPFGVELSADLRPPVLWDPARVLTEAEERASATRSACAAEGEITVTAYVAPGGEVLAAGAASPTVDDDAKLDCLASDVVDQWQMPDPGSYPAKVTFELP